ncbi:MAG: hypothetical protein ACLFSB_15035, partial [Chitinispirillaceae bacterium]
MFALSGIGGGSSLRKKRCGNRCLLRLRLQPHSQEGNNARFEGAIGIGRGFCLQYGGWDDNSPTSNF